MSKKPEWSPVNSGNEFTTTIIDGINEPHKTRPVKTNIKSKPNLNDYIKGVLNSDRTILAQAITLVESNSARHIENAQQVIQKLIPQSGKSIRIGISGAPGAGKSTFIDTFGTYLCGLGHKVAVLAVDPSSTLSKGSILGDKTRMENLSREINAFIRPSPSGGTLGGVARKTRESIILCEAAGFDVILIETIGVGQSEIAVRSMVDFFMLILLPGEGDELQGIKKGSVEIADGIVINKAEGDNITLAKITQQNYKMAVHYIQPATEGWETQVLTASALNNIGIEEIWQSIVEFEKFTKNSGLLEKRRNNQLVNWLHTMLEENIKNMFYKNPSIIMLLPEIEENVLNGKETAVNSVNLLMKEFEENIKKNI